MTHYICTGGCHGMSDEEGVCGAMSCAHHDQPLVPCTCADNKHEKPSEAASAPAAEEKKD